MKSPINVLTYGTFDLLHFGHVNVLKKAKSLGDFLYVGVSNDEFNDSKNKQSHIKYEHRKYLVEELRCVDFAFEEYSWEQKIKDIKKYNIDIFAIGNDWEGKFDFLKEICEVVYIARTPDISSSLIRDRLNNV